MINLLFILLFFILLYTAVLYQSQAALALCVLFIFWSLASFFQVLYCRKMIRIDLPFSAYTGSKEQQAVFTFTLKNTGFLPLSGVRLCFLLLDQTGKRRKRKLYFCLWAPEAAENFL